MFCLPPARSEYPLDEGVVAFGVAGSAHQRLHDRASAVGFVPDHHKLARRLGRRVGLRCVVPVAARSGPLGGDGDPLRRATRRAAPVHARPAMVRRPQFEHVPVRNQHQAAAKIVHHPRRYQVARPVQAGVPGLRIKLAQAGTDGHVRADDQHRVGKPRIAAVGHLVQDRPRGQHRGDRALAGAGRHLGAAAREGGEPLRDPLRRRRIARHVDPLQEIGPGFGEEDHRLHRLALGEEQARVATVALPPVDQLGAGSASGRGVRPPAIRAAGRGSGWPAASPATRRGCRCRPARRGADRGSSSRQGGGRGGSPAAPPVPAASAAAGSSNGPFRIGVATSKPLMAAALPLPTTSPSALA